MHINLRTLLLGAAAITMFSIAPAPAEAGHKGKGKWQAPVISGEFVQTDFDNGGEIHVKFWGRDVDGDGVLYSMAGYLASELGRVNPQAGGIPYPVGNELIRLEVTFINFLGIPSFTQHFDERETPIDLEPNFGPAAFMGFSYNLDGGDFGDDSNEGISFGPLAPSVSYYMGELFEPNLFQPAPLLTRCGQGGDTVCAAVSQLGPFSFELGLPKLTENYSNGAIQVHKGKKKIGSKPCDH